MKQPESLFHLMKIAIESPAELTAYTMIDIDCARVYSQAADNDFLSIELLPN